MTVFYDAADWRNLPHGEVCCFYGDGKFATTGAERASVGAPESRIITVTGNATIASIVDGLPDNLITPAGVRGFVRERRAAAQDAIIYTPRSWVAEYQSVLYDFSAGTLGEYSRLYWWIATLDGGQWTPQGLSDDLAAHWDAELPADRIWAVQNKQIPALGPTAVADQSDLFLPWRPL